jgi:hypothetical protein
MCDYALEWAFFARAQWGQYDSPLYELEHAWSTDRPGRPLPVTMKKEGRPAVPKTVRTAEDIERAVAHYCAVIPYGRVAATTQHLSKEIDYGVFSSGEIQSAIDARKNAGK